MAALTALPYVQVGWFDFVAFDDHQYVSESPLVRQGLDPFAMWDALTGVHADNWHPMVWWSLMLDVQVFGLSPAAFHLENLAWHMANTVLLFVVLKELTDDSFRSAFVAAIFGVHPLHVESVAWITERKDVLSGFFWMLGLWFYQRWARSNQSRALWLGVTSCFLLGLMSKQIVVTLPCVFLLLDAWPLDRLRDPHSKQLTMARAARLFIEKLPWFGLSLLACFVAIAAQQTAKFGEADWPLTLRASNAVVSVVRYIGKAVYPVGLSIQYPFDAPSWPVVLAASIGLIVVTVVCLIGSRRQPAILIGWLWFLVTLVPVSGLIQVGKQSMADRYLYLPLIGLAISVLWSMPTPQSRTSRWCFGGLCGALLLGLTIRTAQQAAVWRNTDTLFGNAIAVDPTNESALYSIGFREMEARNAAEGLVHLHQAVQWDRQRTLARQSYVSKPDPKRMIELNRRWSEIYMNLGRAEAKLGQLANAIADFREAVLVSPTNDDARMALGMALADDGQNDAALEEFEEILRYKPLHEQAATARSVLMQQRPRSPE